MRKPNGTSRANAGASCLPASARPAGQKRPLARNWLGIFLLAGLLGLLRPGWLQAEAPLPAPGPVLETVLQVRHLAYQTSNSLCGVHLQGVALGISPGRDAFTLQDATGNLLVEMDLRAQSELLPGARISLEGSAIAGGGRLRQALVNNDGLHALADVAESLYLLPGRYPMRVEWFNGPAQLGLSVDFQGPGLERQPIPSRVLWRLEAGAPGTHWVHGLDYRCYEGKWDRLPDFSPLTPVASGQVSQFDLRVRTRDEAVGLVFSGYLEIAREGAYTFWTRSDDGSRLWLGEKILRLERLPSSPSALAPPQTAAGQRTDLEGVLSALYVEPDGTLQGRLLCGTQTWRLEFTHPSAPRPPLLSRVQVEGCRRPFGSGQGADDCLVVDTLKPLPAEAPATEGLAPKVNSIAQLRRVAGTDRPLRCPARLEGVVLGAGTRRGTLAFQDDSGAALVEVEGIDQAFEPGQHLILEGICTVEENRLHFSPAAVVENDGVHVMNEQAGRLFLKAGKHALRLGWFNTSAPTGLEVSYQGPELPRQLIPATALFRCQLDPATHRLGWTQGLEYRCVEGQWSGLPAAHLLPAVKTGVVTNFDLSTASRPEDVGLEFYGFLEVPRDGIYTFWTRSDDGSRLWLDEAPVRVVAGAKDPAPLPVRIAARQFLRPDQQDRWSEVEGTVTFAAPQAGGLQLELSSGAGRMEVQVADAEDSSPLLLLKSRLRVRGLSQITYTADGQQVAGLLWVPSARQLEWVEMAPAHWTYFPLRPIRCFTQTNAPEGAETIVHVRGQAHPSDDTSTLVVTDDSGSMLVHTTQPLPQQEGQLIEVLGRWQRVGTNAVVQAGCWRPLAGPSDTEPHALPLLTTLEQVKSLSREEAQRAYPVKIRGLITTVLAGGFFIQDATWAIYARWQPPAEIAPPRVGDYWEVEGVTFAEFAPNIRVQRAQRLGQGTLPEPLRPTWDQLINGSLDTRYVEVQGVVTAVDIDGMTLRTRAGKIKVQLPEMNPSSLRQYENALIRLRGCVYPGRNADTQEVELGQMRFFNASLTVDDPAPADPFGATPKHAADLLLFDSRAGAIQRVKIAGQVLGRRGQEYYLLEGTNGLRFVPKAPLRLPPGELIEVVGFPELGGPSPVLQEAWVRTNGWAPLPPARPLSSDSLLSRAYEATRVRLEARLVGVGFSLAGQFLELDAAGRGFTARLAPGQTMPPNLQAGSRLELTGVYAGQGADPAAGRELSSFELLLNATADIRVLERPSWWTLAHTLGVIGAMGLVIVVALVWISLLSRKVEERSTQLTAAIRRHEQAERQRFLEQERSRIARDLHDELGASLTQIRFLSALESRDSLVPEATRSQLSAITEKSHQMVASLDEIVWAVNPANDSLPSLATYLCLFAEEFFRPTPIRCRLDVAEGLPSLPLTSEVRHALYLVVREALNNIAKHSQATEVWVRIQWQENALSIALEDNGRGFHPQAEGQGGEGLGNMRQRLDQLGGRFDCQTQAGAGTVCRIWLPFPHGAARP